MPSQSVDTTVDTELVAKSRAGEKEAFAELWRRHSSAGRRYAVSVTSALDADDLVAEAFTRILATLQNGHGPRNGFRAYMYVTIRNLVTVWAQAQREVLVDDPEVFDTGDGRSHESRLWERRSVVELLSVVPPRWRQALWLSEVEQLSASELGDALGITPVAAAALTYRAREGLRRAWTAPSISDAVASRMPERATRRHGGHDAGTPARPSLTPPAGRRPGSRSR